MIQYFDPEPLFGYLYRFLRLLLEAIPLSPPNIKPVNLASSGALLLKLEFDIYFLNDAVPDNSLLIKF
jgi:hypothetical protein